MLIQRRLRHAQLCCRRFCQSPAGSTAPTSSSSRPNRVFSGIQPTGDIHLGNYFGAVRRWIDLQNRLFDGDKTRCVYSIVDLHAITMPQDIGPDELRANVKRIAAVLLASGLDPDKCLLFQQSRVPQHGQLAWIFSCLSTMARLGRLPQFKEKTDQMKDIPLGLFAYPVLQAADILLYQADGVPVGEDQIQHLQLANQLAMKFNAHYSCDFFPQIKTLLDTDRPWANRIKSLRQPDKKMSKSEVNVKSRVGITDDADTIRNCISKAVTDCQSAVTFEPDKRPGVSNLVVIYSLFADSTPERVCEECQGLDTGQFKQRLAELVVEKLKPVRVEFNRLMNEDHFITEVLDRGAAKCRVIAEETIEQVRRFMGLRL